MMPCPKCRSETQVVDSRLSGGGTSIRRRRKCRGCGIRTTSYEYFQEELGAMLSQPEAAAKMLDQVIGTIQSTVRMLEGRRRPELETE